MMDLDDLENLKYFERLLNNSGINEKLKEMGVKNKDTVKIDDYSFEYYE